MVAEEKKGKEQKKIKYKIVKASDYYEEARASGAQGSDVRDAAVAILYDSNEGKIVDKFDDHKSGDIKFVVKA